MTTDSQARTFTGDFKRFFIRGLVVVLPTVLTLWIVIKAYQFVDNTIAAPVNGLIRLGMNELAGVWEPLREVAAFQPTPEELATARTEAGLHPTNLDRDAEFKAQLRPQKIEQWWESRWYLNAIGLITAIVAVYVAGRLLGGFVGRRIYRRIEGFITTLPVFKQVYPYVKQIVDFLWSDERPIKFNRVVVLEYPRKGIWSVGFMTGNTMKSIASKSGEAVTVFIPSSPTPFTGYTITVPRDQIVELSLSVDEAIRFTVSGGVLIPAHQQIPEDQLGRPAASAGGPPASDATASDPALGRSDEDASETSSSAVGQQGDS